MTRSIVLLFALGVGGQAALARAEEPKSKGEVKPLWQRLLQGADAKKAAELGDKIEDLKESDKYAEAIKTCEELLALRTRLQGADHWQTVDQKWELETTKKQATWTPGQWARWRKALDGVTIAQSLEAKARFAEAQPFRRALSETFRELLGEEHPYTAAGYNNEALNLQALRKFADAAALDDKTLAIRRRLLGENHPDTAGCYNNAASSLRYQGKFADAAKLDQKALEIRIKVHGDDHVEVAQSCNNLAQNLTAQGDFVAAATLYQKALTIARKAYGEGHSETAIYYNNLASNLKSLGKYAEAATLQHQALAIRRKLSGEDHFETAGSYINLAGILQVQGKHAEADVLYQRALAICRQTLGEKHRLTAQCGSNSGLNLATLGRHTEADKLLQSALDFAREVHGEQHPETARAYNNVAVNLTAQAKYRESVPLLQKALDIAREFFGEEHPNTAHCYNNLGSILNSLERYTEAQPLLQKALAIRRKTLGEVHPDTVGTYFNLAKNLVEQGKLAEAQEFSLAAVRAYEAARLSAGARGLDRAQFGAVHSPYPLLTLMRARLEQPGSAWASAEADLARGLLDEMPAPLDATLMPAERALRDRLGVRLAALQPRILALATNARRSADDDAEFANLRDERNRLALELADLAAAVSTRQVAALDKIQAALPADAALILWLDYKVGSTREHWGCVVRPQGDPAWVKVPGSGPDQKWTDDDTELAAAFRDALATHAPLDKATALARRLHAQRLTPLEGHLRDVKRLFVVPLQQMAGVPIEALTDRYAVSYVPSGTFVARSKDKPAAAGSSILALGDPIFTSASRPAKVDEPLPPGGLLILQVSANGNADKANVRAGDVLLKYAGVELASPEQLGKLIEEKANEKSIELTVWRDGKTLTRDAEPGKLGINLHKLHARAAIAERRRADATLVASRGPDLTELPGTRVEVNRLSQLFGQQATILVDGDASEQKLEELRQSGELSKYRYLHLATHGAANSAQAFESTLYLSRDKLPKEFVLKENEPFINGELSAREVLEFWKLDAELVTLSACETALGKAGGGDGLLGFAQAFLTAGARSVCLSLWKVDDTATALLMDRFYQNLLGKRDGLARPMSRAEALGEAKNWLRNLSSEQALKLTAALTNSVARGERGPVTLRLDRKENKEAPPAKDSKPFAHPKYWAAFILIGDPN